MHGLRDSHSWADTVEFMLILSSENYLIGRNHILEDSGGETRVFNQKLAEKTH